MKRGFAFEKLFKKKLSQSSAPLRPTVSFYALRARGLSGPAATKPTMVQPDKHRLKKLAWRPKFKNQTFKSVKVVATPLMKTGVGVILVLTAYFLFGSKFFELNKLTIQGNRLVDAPTIEKTVFKDGFHKINALLFNEAKASKQILSLAQIKGVDFQKNILQHTLELIVVEHETSLIWRTNNEQFLINRAGVIYDIAPPGSLLIVVEDLKNVPVNLKQQILTTSFIEFVNFVAANLPRKTSLTIRQIVVPETTFELEIVSNEAWKIIFDTTKSPDTQLNNLAKILRGGAKPKQYVDLRILDRVYYK